MKKTTKKTKAVAAEQAVDPSEGAAEAMGLYNEPTAEQVERLVAAARGEEYKPPTSASLSSRPTYAQFERLIAAIKARGGSGAAYPAADGMVDDVYVGTEDEDEGKLVVKFNSAAPDKEPIRVPLSSIVDPVLADKSYITSDQVTPAQFHPGYADRSLATTRVVKEVGTSVDEGTALSVVSRGSYNDKRPDIRVRGTTYDSFFLSSYNVETFDPPIELKYGYCTSLTHYIKIGSRRIPQSISVNSNAWYVQLEDTFYLIKAEYNGTYYMPVATMYLAGSPHPVTYDKLKTTVETVDGQSGIIACSRASIYYTLFAWNLAYRASPAIEGHLAALDAEGNLLDSGKAPGDYQGVLGYGGDNDVAADAQPGIITWDSSASATEQKVYTSTVPGVLYLTVEGGVLAGGPTNCVKAHVRVRRSGSDAKFLVTTVQMWSGAAVCVPLPLRAGDEVYVQGEAKESSGTPDIQSIAASFLAY